VQDYKNLRVWQSSHRLALAIYHATRAFPREETYGLVSQMRRASISIPANIAEGCGRTTTNGLLRFLDIAMGSGSELEYYLLLARDLGYLTDDTCFTLEPHLLKVKKMLNAFIHKLRRDQALKTKNQPPIAVHDPGR